MSLHFHIQVDVAATPSLSSLQPHPQVSPYLHIRVDVATTQTLPFTNSPTGDPILLHPGRCTWLPITPCTLLSHPQVSPCLYIQADVAATHTFHFTISPTGDPIPSHPGKSGCHSHLALCTSSPTDSPIPSHPGRCDDSTEYDLTLKKVIRTTLLQILPQVDVSASSNVSSTCLYHITYCQCQIYLLMSVNSSVKFHHPGPVSPVLQHLFQQTIYIHLCQFCPTMSVLPVSWSGLALHPPMSILSSEVCFALQRRFCTTTSVLSVSWSGLAVRH